MKKPASQFSIEAINRRGPPQCPANPAYPNGIDVGADRTSDTSCRAELPYPAPERLVWLVRCTRCGASAAVTAAGRPDDPRSVRVTCRERGHLLSARSPTAGSA